MAESEQQAGPEKQEQQAPVAHWPYTTAPIPQPFGGIAWEVASRWHALGRGLRHTLPAFLVNHSTNFIGAIHFIAEVFMFKSAGFDLVKKENRGQPIHYLTDPVSQVVEAAAFNKISFDLRDLLRPSSYAERFRRLGDIDGAALRDSAGNTRILQNHWSVRAGAIGVSSMALATVLPDRKESDAEKEQNVTMARQNPLGYVAKRIYQALNPLEWWDNKRHVAGMGMTVTGLCSFISGFRQPRGEFLPHAVTGVNMLKPQHYARNLGQMAGGLITVLAGLQLWFAATNQQAWMNFGTTQLTRMFTILPNIRRRFQPTPEGQLDVNAKWYLGAQATFAFKDVGASLIGGGKRRELGANDPQQPTVLDNPGYKVTSIIDMGADRQDKAPPEIAGMHV